MSDATRAGGTTTGTADARVPRLLITAAAAGMLLFGVLLRHYGLDLVDEGMLLAQTERVRMGQWPYRDFHTGYGPASFALNVGLWRMFGVRIEVVRMGLAVTHAVALAGLAVIAARALGGFAACAVLALTVSFFLPIAPGMFCVWNIPYPGWYAQALGMVALLLALAADRRATGALLASGACWGAAFCFKQNTGVLGLAGVLVWRAFERTEPGEAGRRAWAVALAAALVAGVAPIVASDSLGPVGSIALALPVLALAWRVARLRPTNVLLADAAWLAAGFAVVVVPVLVVCIRAVGWTSLSRQLLHVGSGAVAIYGSVYPGPADVESALAAGASPWRGIRRAVDLAWLFALPLGQLLAAARLRPGAGSVAWRLAVPSAVLAYVQLYPRADFWHLLPVAGLSLVVTVGVVLQALAFAGSGGRRTAGVLLSGLLLLAAVRWLPNVAVVAAALSPAPPAGPLLDRAAIRWDLASSPAVRAVPAVVDAVAGAPRLIGFPALAIFNFLTGIPSPLRHDYFFPGLLGEAEEQAIAAELGQVPDARVVVLHDPLAFFPAAFASHAVIAAAIERDFPRIRHVGPYEVREAAP